MVPMQNVELTTDTQICVRNDKGNYRGSQQKGKRGGWSGQNIIIEKSLNKTWFAY